MRERIILRDRNEHKNKKIVIGHTCSICGNEHVTNYGSKKQPICHDCWNKSVIDEIYNR